MTVPHVTIIEDEPAIAEILQYNLEREGFSVEVICEGDQALAAIRKSLPDLMILDLMLPGLDGLEITRLLKREPTTAQIPLIMLTARDSEVDRIVGLELGADDYITKPFSPREVVLRVKAVLRRANSQQDSETVLNAGSIKLDSEAHRTWVGSQEIHLTATEFRLLLLFVERRGRVQRRTDLLREVWGYTEEVDSRTVDTHVRRLRHKLGNAGDLVETVVGVGYRLRS